MTNELRRALVKYLIKECQARPIEAYELTKQNIITLAATELCEEKDDGTIIDEAHDMGVVLCIADLSMIYQYDGNEIDRFISSDEAELASTMRRATYDGFLDAMHDYCPPNVY